MNSKVREMMPDPDRMDEALLRILCRVQSAGNLTEEEREKLLKPGVGNLTEEEREKLLKPGVGNLPVRDANHLTDQDKRILLCLSHGMDNKGAAETLGISVETVKVHLKKIRAALACKNQAHVVAEAIRRHIID